MSTQTYKCLCGEFEATLTGDAAFTCWCHCKQCRVQTGAPMQLGVWAPDNFKVDQGDDGLIQFASSEKVLRKSCSKCGSFCYKVLPDSTLAIPLGALEPPVAPACNIFCGPEHRGEHKIMAPDKPCHDALP